MTSIKHSDVNAIKCAALSNEMMMMSSFVRERFTPGRGQERFIQTNIQAMAFSVNGVWKYGL